MTNHSPAYRARRKAVRDRRKRLAIEASLDEHSAWLRAVNAVLDSLPSEAARQAAWEAALVARREGRIG